MLFVIIISILCWIIAFSNLVARPINAFLKRPSREERRIVSEIAELRHEQQKISMRDNYTDYIKLDRKIFALDQKLSGLRRQDISKVLLLEYGLQYGIKALFSFVLVIISIAYRWEPVIVYDEKYDFSPFGGLMSFPTGIKGAMSVPFWIFCTSFTFRSIASYLKV